jgi:hypothetical protein
VSNKVGGAVGELPAEVVGVLHAGVEALAAGRRVHVRRVARQEHPTDPEALGQPHVGPPDRAPGEVVQPQAGREPVDERLQPGQGRLAGQRGAELELVGARQRAEHRHFVGHLAGVRHLPGPPHLVISAFRALLDEFAWLWLAAGGDGSGPAPSEDEAIDLLTTILHSGIAGRG